MIPPSTASTALDYLYTQVQATLTAADSTFGIYFGNPPTGAELDDLVWVPGVRNRVTQPLAMVGSEQQWAFSETYDLVVEISVYRGGDNGQTVHDRAWALANAVEAIVRADPTLNNLVTWARPNPFDAPVGWDDNGTGRVCSITYSISCLAQI